MERRRRDNLGPNTHCSLCPGTIRFEAPRDHPDRKAIFAAHFAIEHPDTWEMMETTPDEGYYWELIESNKKHRGK